VWGCVCVQLPIRDTNMKISQKLCSLKDTNSGIFFCDLLPNENQFSGKNSKFPWIFAPPPERKTGWFLELWITESYQNDNLLPKWLLSGSKRIQNAVKDTKTKILSQREVRNELVSAPPPPTPPFNEPFVHFRFSSSNERSSFRYPRPALCTIV
jgi:hypothetical protein